MNTNSKWYMAGTEGTGLYIVVAQNTTGRVGFRPIHGGSDFRVRFEPSEKVLGSYSALKDIHENLGGEWTYPNGQKRFSIVVCGTDGLTGALAHVEEQMEEGGEYEINPSAPGFAKEIFGFEPPVAAPVATATKECGLNEELVKTLATLTQALTTLIAKK